MADTEDKVDILNELAFGFSTIEIEKAKNYASEAYSLANFLGYNEGIAFSLYQRAYIARNTQKYRQAIEYILRANDMVKQDEFLDIQVKILRETANIYADTKNYELADQYYEATIEAAKKLGYQRDVAFVMHNRGLINYHKKQWDDALKFALETQALGDSLGDDEIKAIALRLLGQVYGKGFNQNKKALGYFQRSFELYSQDSKFQKLGELYYEMARSHFALKNYALTDSLLKKGEALAIQLWDPANLLQVYRTYSKLKEQQGDYQNALYYEREATALKDSIEGESKTWKIAKTQSDYTNRQKQEELKQIEAQSSRKTNLLILAISFTLGMSGLLFILYRTNQTRKQRNLALKEKNDEIESFNIELSQKNEEIEAQAEWLRQTNEKVKDQKEELTHLNRMKDRMLSVISHDFRGPLNSLRGALNLLNTHSLPPDQLQMVINDINNKLNRTLNLVDNLLQWTRNQLMGVEVNRESLNMHHLTEETLHLLHPLAEVKRIDLVNDVSEEAVIPADIEMLKVVLRNLVSNAIKFTLRGGEVKVTSKIEDHYLSIQVIDNGIGMTPDRADRVFELGTDRSTLGTANEKGTGIGLLLCKEFIDKHGGHIVVTSKEEKGTTFTFSLPIEVAEGIQ